METEASGENIRITVVGSPKPKSRAKKVAKVVVEKISAAPADIEALNLIDSSVWPK